MTLIKPTPSKKYYNSMRSYNVFYNDIVVHKTLNQRQKLKDASKFLQFRFHFQHGSLRKCRQLRSLAFILFYIFILLTV